MLPQKRHALIHISGVLSHVDGVEILHASVLEAPQKRITSLHAKSSRRKGIVISEAKSMQKAETM